MAEVVTVGGRCRPFTTFSHFIVIIDKVHRFNFDYLEIISIFYYFILMDGTRVILIMGGMPLREEDTKPISFSTWTCGTEMPMIKDSI